MLKQQIMHSYVCNMHAQPLTGLHLVTVILLNAHPGVYERTESERKFFFSYISAHHSCEQNDGDEHSIRLVNQIEGTLNA